MKATKVELYFKIWGSVCRLYEGDNPPIHNHSAMLQFAEEYKNVELVKFARFVSKNYKTTEVPTSTELLIAFKEYNEDKENKD